MSAILGIVGSRDSSIFSSIAGRLERRGQYQHSWSPDRDIYFSHISNNQPVHQEDGLSIFNGFLANKAELTKLLPLKLQNHNHLSNENVLIQLLYNQYGTKIFSSLNGHFVFALWDQTRKCLVLARDRFGVVPLYFSRIGSLRVFASEYKALLALDQIPVVPDRKSIQHYQHTGWVPRGRTFLEDIRSVAPGTFIELYENSENIYPFSLKEIEVSTKLESFKTQMKALRGNFTDATARYSVSTSIGVALSSGIDSSYLLGIVQKTMPDIPIHSFSVGYGRGDPELEGAAITADLLKSIHHEIIVTPNQLVDLLPEAIWHLEDPVGRDQYPCVLALSKEAARFVDILYFGNGADQLFGGLPASHPWLNTAKKFPMMKKPFEDYLSYMKSSSPPSSYLGQMLIKLIGERNLPAPAKILHVEQELNRVILHTEFDHPLHAQLTRDILNGDGHAGLKHQLIASSSNISVRMPFYDENLVEFARTLPDNAKIKWGRGKYILRHASQSILPAKIAWRPKRIQHLLFDQFFSDTLDSIADLLLKPDIVCSRGIFEPSDIARIRRKNQKKPYTGKHLYRLWYLIATEIWARLFLDKRGERVFEFSSIIR